MVLRMSLQVVCCDDCHSRRVRLLDPSLTTWQPDYVAGTPDGGAPLTADLGHSF